MRARLLQRGFAVGFRIRLTPRPRAQRIESLKAAHSGVNRQLIMRLPGMIVIWRGGAVLAGCAGYRLGPVNGAVAGEKSVEVFAVQQPDTANRGSAMR